MFFLMKDLSPYQTFTKSAKMWSYELESRSNPECQDQLCTKHLSAIDSKFFNACQKKVQLQNISSTSLELGCCHFMNGEGRAPVALASLPGSGNTWIRGLLEQATEICSGSAHSCDVELRVGGFSGEAVRSSSVLVVKTHKLGPVWTRSNTTLYSADVSMKKLSVFACCVLS